MRYQKKTKETIRSLRKNGLSLEQISQKTKIPITTIHSWIRDIILSPEQKIYLKDRSQRALQQGRIISQGIIKNKRIEKEKILFLKGKEDIQIVTPKEFFIAGVALYWAEGFKNKHEHRLGFCNSDPDMILFYIKWLEKALNIKKINIIARLTLNESYKDKTKEIEKYWVTLTGIPIDQFTKPFYQHSQWRKQYNTENYHGVLRIHVRNSMDQLLSMKGWIQGLKNTNCHD